jgi:hypothetical protein
MNSARKNEFSTKLSLPWHGWVLGVIFLLYSLAAVFDHVMSLSQGETFYRASGMSEAQVVYFSSVPVWAMIGWTLSVWGGLFGSLALLFRRRFAGVLFSASLLGGLIYMLHVLVLSAGREAMGVLWVMPIVIAVITTAIIFYCQGLTKLRILG